MRSPGAVLACAPPVCLSPPRTDFLRRHRRIWPRKPPRHCSRSSQRRIRKSSASSSWWSKLSAMPAFGGGGSPNLDFSSFDSIDATTFLAGLMPKREIEADKFLELHPDYDGRGVTIAIFDSGVDPAAAGLQTTTDGKPKIIDIVDCTGSGDIDTSKVVRADENGCIAGASGATLRVNSSWTNPSGEWRVGCKFVYQLFPETLSTRLKKERKKNWDERHREASTAAMRELQAFDAKYSRPADLKLKKQREDLQNRVDLLGKLAGSYEDKGPIIDAVVWHDGKVWRAAIDTQDMETDGVGKLENFLPMTNYRTERQYAIFTKMDGCTFVTNIYDDGNVLSIVTDCSPHATHVAGITAAHHPEEPLLNGVAPGAQLVSCKIGDTRLGSMETGTGLTRALIAVIENKCDLINMSYGEPTRAPDYGRFCKLADEVVHKHGVIFVSSAGNNGPSLSTVGAPGGTSSSIIGIGAYVSPVMAAAAHSLVEPPPDGLQYTWSSRGPTADGDIGVCLSAPGGAVAPVPQWTLQRRMLMNGTSMASPCACGGVALVLSGLKQEGKTISPYTVRKALENTAAPTGNSPDEVLTMGRGLLQVVKAYEYLQKGAELPPVCYSVHISKSSDAGQKSWRGIYLRDLCECQHASEWTVQAKPTFPENADKLKVVTPFEERIRLESTSATWVKCPEYLLLTHNGRTFNMVVDPTNLDPGLHYAEVVGLDCEAPWRGPLFRVPVTVIKPVEILDKPSTLSFSKLAFSPGHIERRFIAVPEGATWAEVTLRCDNFDTTRRFYLDAVQLPTKSKPSVWESVLTLNSPTVKSFAFSVEAGLTMEFTIAQFWSSGSGSHVPAHVDLEFEFRGLVGGSSDVLLNGSDIVTRMDVKSFLSSERLSPAITLTRVRTPYRPSECKLEALSAERDKLPDGRQIHALTLLYKVNLSEAGKVTPRFPYLNGRIYDNAFESQFYMISDTNKRIWSMGDVYPKGVKLPKGEYHLRLYIRHDNASYLEKLKKAVIFIDKSLDDKNVIRLNTYGTIDGAVLGSETFKSSTLSPGECQALYIASPPDDKTPKDASVGTLLMGKVTLGKIAFSNRRGEQNGQACPASMRVTVAVAPAPKNDDKAKENKEGEQKKSPFQKIEEEVRDAKIKILSLLPRSTEDERTAWGEQAKALKEEFPRYLPLVLEILRRLASCPGEGNEKNFDEIIEAAGNVVELIDTDALAKYFAMKSESEDPDAMQVKKEMEYQRDALVEALCKKLTAIADKEDEESKVADTSDTAKASTEAAAEGAAAKREDQEKKASSEEDALESTSGELQKSVDAFESTFGELRKWVDITSTSYALISSKRERRLGRLGTALKLLNELLQDESKPAQKNLFELRIGLLKQLGWRHWAEYEEHWLAIRFPPSLPLF